MNVRTIVYTDGGFWASEDLWHDPAAAVRVSTSGWVYLGSPGWHGTAEAQRRYAELAAQVDLTDWWDGEHAEVNAWVTL